MGLAEVAQGDGAINGRNDLGETNICWSLCEHVSAANASLGANETGAFEGEKNLFEVWLGETSSVCDVANRGGRTCFGVQRKRQKCPAGIITSCRNSHKPIVGGELVG
jgi:hypothetical protein